MAKVSGFIISEVSVLGYLALVLGVHNGTVHHEKGIGQKKPTYFMLSGKQREKVKRDSFLIQHLTADSI